MKKRNNGNHPDQLALFDAMPVVQTETKAVVKHCSTDNIVSSNALTFPSNNTEQEIDPYDHLYTKEIPVRGTDIYRHL